LDPEQPTRADEGDAEAPAKNQQTPSASDLWFMVCEFIHQFNRLFYHLLSSLMACDLLGSMPVTQLA